MSNELILIYTTYFLATFSPGPSNMAIMGVAVQGQRSQALQLALGVICGSMTWALIATLGVTSLLREVAGLFFVMKIIGGAYLLYLSWQSGRKLLRSNAATAGKTLAGGHYFRQGILMHLTNPKAILTWAAIMSLSLKNGLNYQIAAETISGCLLISILVFSFYAIAFSAPLMTRLFKKIERTFQVLLTLFYGVAGLKLLFSGK